MGCSGSSNSTKKPAQQSASGQQVKQAEAKGTAAGGARASEYKAPQDFKYPSLEPPVIDNKQAIEKGYISSKGAGQTKMEEANKNNKESKSESNSDEDSDEDSDMADSEEASEESDD